MASLSQQPEHGGWSERAAGDWCGTAADRDPSGHLERLQM